MNHDILEYLSKLFIDDFNNGENEYFKYKPMSEITKFFKIILKLKPYLRKSWGKLLSLVDGLLLKID